MDSETAFHGPDETEIDGHLLNAQLLADAAEQELYARGVKPVLTLPTLDLFICEIESLARETGVPYERNGRETQ